MRLAAACIFTLTLCASAVGTAQAQISLLPAPKSSAPAQVPAPTPAAVAPTPVVAPVPPAAAPVAPPPVSSAASCTNPNALGIARVVEIDTTGGPGFGFEHFKAYDFLKPGEVVLTFDDGPWPGHTPAVLAALANHCTKAIFFPIGKHASWHPEILKQVIAAGHTVGSHTWSHVALSKKTFDQAKEEFEKGLSGVKVAAGGQVAPFFRFPALQHPPEMVEYLAKRNIAIWSTDMDSFDFKMRKPEQVIKSVMDKLKKHGKGIVLMHDFQQATANGIAELLNQIKAGGYKVVQVKAKEPAVTLADYDAMVLKEIGGGIANARPITSVVRTIEGN